MRLNFYSNYNSSPGDAQSKRNLKNNCYYNNSQGQKQNKEEKMLMAKLRLLENKEKQILKKPGENAEELAKIREEKNRLKATAKQNKLLHDRDAFTELVIDK